MKRYYYLMLSALLLTMAACAPQAAENRPEDATEGVVAENLPSIEQTAVMVTAEGETQLYTDAELGFSFEYPTTWIVEGREGSSVTLMSFSLGDATAEPIPGGLPEGETRIDFAPLSEEITTFDEGVAGVRDGITENGDTIVSDEEIRLVDNRLAQRIETETSGTLLVTEINERVLVITAQGNPAELELIEQTLRDVG